MSFKTRNVSVRVRQNYKSELKKRTTLETFIHVWGLGVFIGIFLTILHIIDMLFPGLNITNKDMHLVFSIDRHPLIFTILCLFMLCIFGLGYFFSYKKSFFPILLDLRIDSLGYIIMFLTLATLHNVTAYL